MPRLARGLHPRPREKIEQAHGGLDLRRLVQEAHQVYRFEELFGQPTDLVELIAKSVQRQGWTLSTAEIREALEELA